MTLVTAVDDRLRESNGHTLLVIDDLIGYDSHVGSNGGELPQGLQNGVCREGGREGGKEGREGGRAKVIHR